MMKKTVLIVIWIAFTLLAQERPQPPTAITLPSDSLSARGSTGKITPSSDQIELPDVLVVGRDRSQRRGQEKIASSNEGPRLLAAQYGPFSLWTRRSNDRPSFGDSSVKRSGFWAGLRGGSRSSLAGDAGYAGSFSTATARFSGWMQQSHGAYRNSDYADAGLDAASSWNGRNGIVATGSLSYSRDRRGMYGAQVASADRFSDASTVALSGLWPLGENSQADGEISYQSFQGRTDSSGGHWVDIQSRNLQIGGRWQKGWNDFSVCAAADYRHESLREASTELAELQVEAWTPLAQRVNVKFRMALQNFISDSVSMSRFSPSAQLFYLPNDRTGLTLQLASGLHYQNYYQAALFNPFIAHSHVARPQDEAFAVTLEGEIKIGTRWLAAASLHRGWEKTYIYWQRQAATGFIAQESAKDVDLLEWRLSTRYRLDQRLSVHASATMLADRLPTGQSNRLPYRSDYQLEAGTRFDLTTTLYMTAEVEWVGPRRAEIESTRHLPSYALANMEIRQRLKNLAEIFLTINNLFNQKFEIWQGYRDPGLMIWTGARVYPFYPFKGQ